MAGKTQGQIAKPGLVNPEAQKVQHPLKDKKSHRKRVTIKEGDTEVAQHASNLCRQGKTELVSILKKGDPLMAKSLQDIVNENKKANPELKLANHQYKMGESGPLEDREVRVPAGLGRTKVIRCINCDSIVVVGSTCVLCDYDDLA